MQNGFSSTIQIISAALNMVDGLIYLPSDRGFAETENFSKQLHSSCLQPTKLFSGCMQPQLKETISCYISDN